MKRFQRKILETHLNLYYTLFSGQCFGWDRESGEEGWFSGFFRWEGTTCRARMKRHGELILCETDAGERWFQTYFNLGVDINEVYASFPDDPKLAEAIERFRGMRVLCQDPWETLVSFTISQNNNIKRIRLVLRRMVEAFGRFPEPEDMLSEKLLLRLGLGYRARYLVGISEKVISGEFDPKEPIDSETEDGLARLLCLPGVGKKVAHCTLLYGYGVNNAFPVDRWIRKAGEPGLDYGPYAGWAQLYLYVLARDMGGEM
ncbi:MAG: DNA-3-methyladenine glycosylase family protein [candidate division WOR-3 bacterium]